MHAAVVTSFDSPPTYQEFAEPVAQRPDEQVVDVVAAALFPLARSKAAGAHYTSTGELPVVPGVDGVVRDARGQLLYTVLDDTAFGTFAERTVVRSDRCVPLPEGVDPITVAAALNPVMSSWVALRHRIDFRPGSRVLVTGATGSSGRAAIQVAKLFGAAEVIAAGRNVDKLAELPALGADRVLTLDQLAQASEVDVVIDYLWGEPAARGMVDLLTHRSDRTRPLTWIEIGSMAGPSAPIPSAALRSARLEIVGSGIGSVPGDLYRAELGEIVRAVADGRFDIRARAVALSEVEAAWTASDGADRIVFTP